MPTREGMNENSPSQGSIQRHLAADPLPWALWLILRRAASKIKSSCLGRLFGARGLYLGPGCRIIGSRFIRFGANFYVQGDLWLETVSTYRDQRFHPFIEIGDDVSISERVHISCIDRIQIGRRVLIGSGVYIGDHQHGIYSGADQTQSDVAPASRSLGGGGPVFIGENVWIGDNTVIVGPVSIGRGAIIGANSVIRRDVPECTIVAGSPARAIKRFNQMSGQWEKIGLSQEEPCLGAERIGESSL